MKTQIGFHSQRRRKMKKLCCSLEDIPSSSSSSASISEFPFGSSSSRLTFADSVMNRTLGMAEPIIMKWNPETTTVVAVTSMFYESRREAGELIQWVNNLQKAMRLVVMENTNPKKMVRAQDLMQMAMKRLQKEFYQILSINRAHLDPESVSTRSSRVSTRSSTSGCEDEDNDDDIRIHTISQVEDASRIAMADLRSIAECMISCGYGKECMTVYKIIRKSIIDEGIYRLGVEKLNPSLIRKMNWEALDVGIKSWLDALETSVQTLFDGERMLCDHVFASSESIRESCFTEVARGGAMILFGFPENVVKNSRKFPENVFRALDMYVAISNHMPEIESIFSFDSTANIKSKALTSLVALSEYVKAALNDLESAIQKESSKTPAAGAGIHDLTINAMNYLSLLADYRNILNEIFPESPPPEQKFLPESYLGLMIDPDDPPPQPISVKIAWLVLAVLCKLDTKSKFFKDVSLSYLFLANNLQYVVVKVRTSNLRHMLGDKWLTLHECKVKQFAASYERLGWSHVIESLPSDPSSLTDFEQVKQTFKRFNLTFDEVCSQQSLCVVTDNRLRDDIKESLARKIFCSYRELYNTHGRTMSGDRNSAVLVRFTPDDVEHRLSDLFFGEAEPGTSLSFKSSAVREAR